MGKLESYAVRPQRRTPDTNVTSKNIDGISDLVVWAPIREGFIDAFNNVTYESRLRLVGEGLHSLRKAAREHEKIEPYADTAKRIISLLDFRIGVVDRDLIGAEENTGDGSPRSFRPRKYMYLVATFDGPLEPYMRLIYDPLGTFLDLVLCNCEGYKPALGNDFQTYIQWVRDNQLDSAIFYSTSGMSVGDKIYLEELEAIQRSKSAHEAELEISGLTFTSPDAAAEEVRTSDPIPSLKLGLEALNVIYKLTDLYPPNSADGKYLRHAAKDLLGGLTELLAGSSQGLPDTLKQPLSWFLAPLEKPERPYEPGPEIQPGDIQKGLMSSYDSENPDEFCSTNGALLLCRFDDAAKARVFLSQFPVSVETDEPFLFGDPGDPDAMKFYVNFALSMNGLDKLGIPKEEQSLFPKEFREGAKERAPLVGDKFDNHPRNWNLPKRNWPDSTSAQMPVVELSEIDLVIQIRADLSNEVEDEKTTWSFIQTFIDCITEIAENAAEQRADATTILAKSNNRPFEDVFSELLRSKCALDNGKSQLHRLINIFQTVGDTFGYTLLSVESMSRALTDKQKNASSGRSVVRDHFGFVDGISQPVVDYTSNGTPPGETDHPMAVLPGDVFIGHANSRHDQHYPEYTSRLSFNGSFLVIRKISQDVGAFRRLEDTLRETGPAASMALIVGRTEDGAPLVDPANTSNDFKYDKDPEGNRCPLSAHIRLANPRGEVHGRRDPMILRRGMSYGVPYDIEPHQDRGIVFMAYCASLAEQYEIIQRWLNGANPTGVNAMRNDPLTGSLDRRKNGTQTFGYRCPAGDARRLDIPEPLTKLEWASYFFVPSKTALLRIGNLDEDPVFREQLERENSSRVSEGERVIQELEKADKTVRQLEWKKIIEDFLIKDPSENDLTPKVWEAIDRRGGAYRIDDGIAFDQVQDGGGQGVVLVTDAQLITDILSADAQYPKGPYSCQEQRKRINEGFGTIYVCLDGDEEYYDEAADTNHALMGFSQDYAFKTGYRAARQVLSDLQNTIGDTASGGVFKAELSRQFIQPATAGLCHQWYGIPDETFIKTGAWDWGAPDTRGAYCPGDFLSPSRHTFYPRPTSHIADYGRLHGKELAKKAREYVETIWDCREDEIVGSIAKKIHADMKAKAATNPDRTEYYKDLMVRNMIGGMVGAIPPMDGCMRWALFDWLREDTLWEYQGAYAMAKKGEDPFSEENMALAFETVQPGLRTAMCVRPAPDLLYRTVKKNGARIADIDAQMGDLVILCLSAATQAALAQGNNDVTLVFGGDRKLPDGSKNPSSGLHSCPAKDLAMGGMTGILTALLDYGSVKALPASLIVEITPHQQGAGV